MGYVRVGIFVLVILAFGILSHSASATCTANSNPCTYSNGNNAVKVQYYALPAPPATSTSVTQIAGNTTNCPSPNSRGCGYALLSSLVGTGTASWVNWQTGTLPSNSLTFTFGVRGWPALIRS